MTVIVLQIFSLYFPLKWKITYHLLEKHRILQLSTNIDILGVKTSIGKKCQKVYVN